MSIATTTERAPSRLVEQLRRPMSVRVHEHSPLVYWWPLWAVGFVMAFLTYFYGNVVTIGDIEVQVHASKNLGVIYCMVAFTIIVLTNIPLRGMASIAVITSILGLTFLFAYMNWWDNIFRVFDKLVIFANFGFYIVMSTGLLLIWIASVFVVDRLEYWEFRPGQMVHHSFFGGGEQSYDTHGMAVNKLRDDLFRHWILGIGSGDLSIVTTGAERNSRIVHNVLAIGPKLERLQQLIAMKPDQENEVVTVVAGDL